MSKTTAGLKTRQTIVFPFVLGYKLGHSCTYRQIVLNDRIYSIKATNLKLAPTSNKRPSCWIKNWIELNWIELLGGKFKKRQPIPTTSTPLPPFNYNKINKNWSGQEELVVAALFAPYRSSVPVFLPILFSCWSYWPCVPTVYQCTLILTISLWRQSGRRTQAITGAPNEDIVQNHLTWHCWTYFSIQTVDIGIFLSPKNFSSVRIS